ncbi:inositol polyphosphate 1-phosphatase [Tribolium castaneum]|uniref:inositol-1,4-bisphosphate 1-phosphatase n=1 Tax=Tribolium castaneum TaxID=7070 RepID=D7EIV5_TRICA|nr:PREDICTED: inositol polyphosphate 1-phosphatase [Tribolium castaneum]XP_968404.1 PREDICTED: inositol polyphosphate 1-phosphatase [Tribolium castaneum]EFA12380.1 Putative inositol monophosphatase 3-like Protein [Tribolium castaneum]|eukprot:XP_015839616.1 PREDICTED: inositol polyphosphate 1-phosphatase [Tribolium castaneum]
MDLLQELIIVSEKAANIARLCRQNQHLFTLLIQKKSEKEANSRFVEDFKTLADVLIQQLVQHDIGAKFPALKSSIFGEETNTFRNKLGDSITVEIKDNQQATANLLRIVLNQDSEAADLLSHEVHKKISLPTQTRQNPSIEFTLSDEIGIWIDPIDSTAEYINGIEEITNGVSTSGLKCVTVLIGVFDKRAGLPVVGVINQPFVESACFWGHALETNLPPAPAPTKSVCVSSSENREVLTKLTSNGYNLIEASGAGYKILTVITGQADAYILTKDTTFKWDTCGPHAILRAQGGDIVVFRDALNGVKTTVTYTEEKLCNSGGIIAYRSVEVLNDLIKILRL